MVDIGDQLSEPVYVGCIQRREVSFDTLPDLFDGIEIRRVRWQGDADDFELVYYFIDIVCKVR